MKHWNTLIHTYIHTSVLVYIHWWTATPPTAKILLILHLWSLSLGPWSSILYLFSLILDPSSVIITLWSLILDPWSFIFYLWPLWYIIFVILDPWSLIPGPLFFIIIIISILKGNTPRSISLDPIFILASVFVFWFVFAFDKQSRLFRIELCAAQWWRRLLLLPTNQPSLVSQPTNQPTQSRKRPHSRLHCTLCFQDFSF